MRLKKKRKARWKIRVLPVAAVVLVWYLVSACVSLRPAFWALAEMEARVRATEVINRAVKDHIARDPVLLHVERDSYGRVTLVQPNLRVISELSATASQAIQEEMKSLRGSYVELPLGLLTGSYLFAGSGLRLRVRLLHVGSVSVDVLERFEAVGINQTRHVIMLRTATTMRVITPFESRDVPVESTYPVTEVVFSGEVPRIMGIPR